MVTFNCRTVRLLPTIFLASAAEINMLRTLGCQIFRLLRAGVLNPVRKGDERRLA
jgi:hypothetical protein